MKIKGESTGGKCYRSPRLEESKNNNSWTNSQDTCNHRIPSPLEGFISQVFAVQLEKDTGYIKEIFKLCGRQLNPDREIPTSGKVNLEVILPQNLELIT